MREMRIMLPDELWKKFAGFSPQKMKDFIRTTICLHYGISPEKRMKKKPNPAKGRGKVFRDDKGKFLSHETGQTDHADKATKMFHAGIIGKRIIDQPVVASSVDEMPAAENSTVGVSPVSNAVPIVAPQPPIEFPNPAVEERQNIRVSPTIQVTIPTHKKIKMNEQYLSAF